MEKNKVKYRSYKDKKSQSKSFRLNFIRTIIFIIIFAVFTTYIAVGYKITNENMSPNFAKGDIIIFNPYSLSRHFNATLGKNLKRGDIVITSTNYAKESSLIDNLLDPIIRTFTLQRVSILYDNSGFKGNSEILRVLGLPGDTVKIQDNTVYVKPKGQEYFLSEFELTKSKYDVVKGENDPNWEPSYPFSSDQGEVLLKDSDFFLISDNRQILNDSRIFGPINSQKIKGKVLLKYWPLGEFSFE